MKVDLFSEITGSKNTSGMILKAARHFRGFTQLEVEEITGIKISSISKYENDKLDIGVSVALRFAAVYKISPLTILSPIEIKS